MVARFEKLAEDVSKDAMEIECSPQEYREGLRAIILRLDEDLRAAEEMDR